MSWVKYAIKNLSQVIYANGKRGSVIGFDSQRGHVMENAQAFVELVICRPIRVRIPVSPYLYIG